MGKPDNRIIEFLISFRKYLNEKGYNIPQSSLAELFKVIEIYGIDVSDIEKLSKLAKPYFTQTKEQAFSFERDFIDFYNKEIVVVVNSEESSNLSNVNANVNNLKKKVNSLEKAFNRKAKQLESLSEEISYKLDDKDLFSNSPKIIKKIIEELEDNRVNKLEVDKYRLMLQQELIARIRDPKFIEIAKEIENMNEALVKVDNKKSINTVRRELEEEAERKRITQEALINSLKKLEDAKDLLIKKNKSKINREEFIRINNRAVQSTYDGDVDLNVKFSEIKDTSQLEDVVKHYANRLKSKAINSIKSNNRHRLDFKQTYKKAMETGGVPIRLSYIKPKISRSKLIMFLDISGSCREASELMLKFMYIMREVFQGGCKTYVFVNRLYDVSEFMELPDIDLAIKEIFNAIPTRGVYSDYYRPFEEFNLSEVTKESILFFIGDARNNKNPTGEENIKNICRKAKRSYWFNTEDFELWNTGDSIASIYGKYMNRQYEVTTPMSLINSLMDIFA